MKQSMMGKFQVIGRCAKTQTLSWEDELRLFDGVPYDVDFSRECSFMILDGGTLRDMPAADLIKAILSPPEVPALQGSTAPSYPISSPDWVRKQVKRIMKDDKKEQKWQKKQEEVSSKEAWKRFKEVLKDLDVYDD